jgi:regulatory protein
MKITAIIKQIGRDDRYSIFVDGEYIFSLSGSALLDSKLIRNQELSKEELKVFQQKSADDKLYNQTLSFVALRPRTKAEVEDYLKKKHSPAPLVEQITNKLYAIGLLDDAKYAQSFVNDRRLLRPTSRRKMIVDLRKKNVSKDVAEEIVGSSKEDELAALLALIARKRRQPAYRDNLKLMQYLSRQGFRYEDIKTALRQSEDVED